jgi:transposase-like protein
MDVHQNAGTTRRSRMLMVERLSSGWSVASVASAFGVDPRTERKWRDRFAAEGEAGLCDRSSRPRLSPGRLDTEIAALRRQCLSGPTIARRLGRPVSTIGLVLRRQGLAKLSALDPRSPVCRYERERPGELIHIDIKKAGLYRASPSSRRSRNRSSCGAGAPRLLETTRFLGRREEGERDRLPRPRARLVRGPRRQRRWRHDRQWLGLPEPCLA